MTNDHASLCDLNDAPPPEAGERVVDDLTAHSEEVAESCELIRSDPEPRVRFRTFGDSGLNFELLGWIDVPDPLKSKRF